jgi:hypothetical protein
MDDRYIPTREAIELVTLENRRKALPVVAPIERLPNELLITILILATTGCIDGEERSIHFEFPEAPNRHSLGEIVAVCRHWRKLVINCPRFWSTISFSSPRAWNETQLLRSKSTPLSLIRLNTEPWDFFNSTFSRHAPQVREVMLEFNIEEMDGFFVLLGTANLPVLETLHLLPYFDPLASEFPVFQPQIPSLRRLYLCDVIMPWNSPQLASDLTHLSIWFSEHDPDPSWPRPTIPQLLDLLKAATSLQSLELCEVMPLYSPTTIVTRTNGAVRLNALSHLKLDHHHLATSVQLLPHLILPQSTYVDLSTPSREFTDTLELAAIHAIPHSHFQSDSKLFVGLIPDIEFHLEILGKPVWRLAIYAPSYHQRYYELEESFPLIQAAFSNFPQLRYLEISVDFPDDANLVFQWHTAFCKMENITELCIKSHRVGSWRTTRSLLDALASPLEGGQEGVGTLFPRLRKLELHGSGHSRTLDTIELGTISELVQRVLKMRRLNGVGIEHLKISGNGLWGDVDAIASLVDVLEYSASEFEESC